MKSWLVKFQLHGRKFQIASKNVALAKGNILADYLISTAFDIIQLAKQKVRPRNEKESQKKSLVEMMFFKVLFYQFFPSVIIT